MSHAITGVLTCAHIESLELDRECFAVSLSDILFIVTSVFVHWQPMKAVRRACRAVSLGSPCQQAIWALRSLEHASLRVDLIPMLQRLLR